jgi:hypothetical protein
LATYRFPGNTAVLFAFVAGNFVPMQILMIPVRDMALKVRPVQYRVGTGDVSHLSFQTGFCTLFLRNFIKQLPFELIEAARVEGASEWTIYLRIVLPLIRPALAALGILVFTFVWNDYFWALCLTQGDEAAPITVGVAALKGQWTTCVEPGRGGFGAGRVAFGADVLRDAKAFRRRPDFWCKQGLSACLRSPQFATSVTPIKETYVSCNLVFAITRNNGPASMWADDAKRMAELGITHVRIAEFAWSRMEPRAGQYEWEWLDEADRNAGGCRAESSCSVHRPRRRRGG